MFISNAYAQVGTPGQMDMLTSFLPMAAIFVVFYFLLIRPQQKRAREQKELLGALEKGNEVVTAGGIVGRITKINEQYVSLEIATGTEMTVQRSAVAQLLQRAPSKPSERPKARPTARRWPRAWHGNGDRNDGIVATPVWRHHPARLAALVESP